MTTVAQNYSHPRNSHFPFPFLIPAFTCYLAAESDTGCGVADCKEMLKSTYKPAIARGTDTLPDGWTEHKAPTGKAPNPASGKKNWAYQGDQVSADYY